MTSLDGENNTGEKVREEKRTVDVAEDGNRKGWKCEKKEDENTSSLLLFPLSQPAGPSFQSC